MQPQNMERKFKSEHLFGTCSVVTSLVTSLEFYAIHCATVVCHFGQTRNGSVATHFNLFSCTATSSATGDYVVVPESFGQNEEPACTKRSELRTSLVPLQKCT